MFSDILKNLRRDQCVSQAKLAMILGVGQSTVANWETEQRQPDFEMLCQIASYFNVTVDYLLGREAKTTDTPETEDSDDIRMIQRARKKMSPQDKEKMMCVLKTIFEEAFDDDNKQN